MWLENCLRIEPECMPILSYQAEEEYPGKNSMEEWAVWQKENQPNKQNCPGSEVKKSPKEEEEIHYVKYG